MIEAIQAKMDELEAGKQELHRMIAQYGHSVRKFADGQVVKVASSGRLATVKEAEFTISSFSKKFELSTRYYVIEKASRRGKWLREVELRERAQ